MDGAPVKGETIPIRLFLSGFDLTPTFRDVNKKYSIRYYINLVLVDEERRRYYKQQEITLLRRPEDAPIIGSDGIIVPKSAGRVDNTNYKGLATSPPKQKEKRKSLHQEKPQPPRPNFDDEEPTAIASSAPIDDDEEREESSDVLFEAEASTEALAEEPIANPDDAHFNPFRDLQDEPLDDVTTPHFESPQPPAIDGMHSTPFAEPENTFTTVPPWLEESPWASAPSATSQQQSQQHAQKQSAPTFDAGDRDVL